MWIGGKNVVFSPIFHVFGPLKSVNLCHWRCLGNCENVLGHGQLRFWLKLDFVIYENLFCILCQCHLKSCLLKAYVKEQRLWKMIKFDMWIGMDSAYIVILPWENSNKHDYGI